MTGFDVFLYVLPPKQDATAAFQEWDSPSSLEVRDLANTDARHVCELLASQIRGAANLANGGQDATFHAPEPLL
jgi:hypothetical protein